MSRKTRRRALPELDLLHAPGHLLRRNHQRSYEIFTRLVGDDVTRQQLAFLIALAQNPGASQTALVEATAIDKSTLKEMLGRLVRRGWVERRRSPADARAWTLQITSQGIEALRQRMDAVRAAQAEILAPLPPRMRTVFIRCLRLLIGLTP